MKQLRFDWFTGEITIKDINSCAHIKVYDAESCFYVCPYKKCGNFWKKILNQRKAKR